jgi:hypothetical protein
MHDVNHHLETHDKTVDATVLRDDLFDSKNWKEADTQGRIEWLIASAEKYRIQQAQVISAQNEVIKAHQRLAGEV